MTEQFQFELGSQICDKDVKDVRLVVGRVLDSDENNQPTYILKGRNGIDWMVAETAHKFFRVDFRAA